MIDLQTVALLIAVVCTLTQRSPAQQSTVQRAPAKTSTEDLRLRNVEILADVWGKLELFHPMVAVRGRFWWDSVFMRAVSRAEDARSNEELVRVLNEDLFESIGDPLSFARTGAEANQLDFAQTR